MGIMLEECKSSPKRDTRNTKGKKFSRASLLEVLAQGGTISSYTAEDGTVRMKILLKKQDLKKFMNNNNNVSPPSQHHQQQQQPSSIERRLNELKRKKRANNANKKVNSSSSWRPVLQSIPEEH